MSNHLCKRHNVPLEDAECNRCRGQGYTDWDIEEMENPISFHDGNCYQCKGSGVLLAWECPICEEEYRDEEEAEYERELEREGVKNG